NHLIKTISNNLGETTQFFYDDFGNLNKKILPEGEEILYARGVYGNITGKTIGVSTTHYTYDLYNRLTSVATGVSSSDPIGNITSYIDSRTGQLESITDPQSNITSFEYNSRDQMIRKT